MRRLGQLREVVSLNDAPSLPTFPASARALAPFAPLPCLALSPVSFCLAASLCSGRPCTIFQYPASGLLLRDEFRTFVEIDSEGERIYEPVEPLVRLLRNFGIVDGGVGADGFPRKQQYETLVMRVTVPAHSRSWGINICPKNHKDFEEIAFHFNPRRRFVAMNNREGNIWGQQVWMPPARALSVHVSQLRGGKLCCCSVATDDPAILLLTGTSNHQWSLERDTAVIIDSYEPIEEARTYLVSWHLNIPSCCTFPDMASQSRFLIPARSPNFSIPRLFRKSTCCRDGRTCSTYR